MLERYVPSVMLPAPLHSARLADSCSVTLKPRTFSDVVCARFTGIVMHGFPAEMHDGAGPAAITLSVAVANPQPGLASVAVTSHGAKATVAPTTASPVPGPVPDGPL